MQLTGGQKMPYSLFITNLTFDRNYKNPNTLRENKNLILLLSFEVNKLKAAYLFSRKAAFKST
ncbi:hypothetical protein ZMO02_11970 [Zymomonas mobilis subsp. pomaceae]|nr:hypothetical protein ZMO02_11970 [Zymomonas mobilis subsp. pomaceae]